MLRALLIATSLSFGLSAVSASAGPECGTGWVGPCPTSESTGTEVVVTGERPPGSQPGEWGSDGGTNYDDDSSAPPDTTPQPPTPPREDNCSPANPTTCFEQPDVPAEPAIPQPTLADVARFAPASVPLVDEPDGVGVVGMPMNFVVDAQTHERTGTLFDLPVTVRFTPASVLFVHGDGTSRVSDGGGRSWATLGLAQFSATPTSHAYTARGSYTASAVVRYAAQVNFGNGWVAVPGVLEIPTTSGDVQIFEVRTALVDKTCLENPGGVGC